MTRPTWREVAGWRPSTEYMPRGLVDALLSVGACDGPATGPSHTNKCVFVVQGDLAVSTARFYPSNMQNWAIDPMVAITLASSLSGCTPEVEYVELANSQPSTRRAPRPPDARLAPSVATPTSAAAPAPLHGSRRIKALQRSGEHPLAGAVPAHAGDEDSCGEERP